MEGDPESMPHVGSLIGFAVLGVAVIVALVRLVRLEKVHRGATTELREIARERERRAAMVQQMLTGAPPRPSTPMEKARERWTGPLVPVVALGLGLAGLWRRLVADPSAAAVAAVAVIGALAVWWSVPLPPERPDDRTLPPAASPTVTLTGLPSPTVPPTSTPQRTPQRTGQPATTGASEPSPGQTTPTGAPQPGQEPGQQPGQPGPTTTVTVTPPDTPQPSPTEGPRRRCLLATHASLSPEVDHDISVCGRR